MGDGAKPFKSIITDEQLGFRSAAWEAFAEKLYPLVIGDDAMKQRIVRAVNIFAQSRYVEGLDDAAALANAIRESKPGNYDIAVVATALRELAELHMRIPAKVS